MVTYFLIQCFDTLPDPPPPDPHFWQQPAFWMWVAILTEVLVFDLIMLHKHQTDLSRFLQHLAHPRTWLKYLFLAITLVAGIHFGWGL